MKKQKNSKKKYLVFLLMVFIISGCITIPAEAAIKISEKRMTLYVGQKKTLKIRGTVNKAKWNTNSKSIASVSKNGDVKAKKKGTAVITAKVKNKKYTCKVIVKNPTLSKKSIILKIGDSCTLKLKGSTVKNWSSDDTAVVTVSKKGCIVAKNVGKANVVATAKNGKKYKCAVTVSKDESNGEYETSRENNGGDGSDWFHSHYHDYVETITQPATCTEDGEKTFACVCGESYTRIIYATGHNYKESIVYANDGSINYVDYECQKCGKHKTFYVISFLHSHPYIYANEPYQVEVKTNMGENAKYIKFKKGNENPYVTVSEDGIVTVISNPPEDTYISVEMYLNLPDSYICEEDDLEYINPLFEYSSKPYTNIAIKGGRYGECRIKEKQILNDVIDESMNDAEKVFTIHNWIALNTVYDVDTLSGENVNYESYDDVGVILNKKAVCSGYAEAFRDFMDLLGIQCNIVSSREMDHAWNQVCLDNEWYWIDCQGDDASFSQDGSRLNYSYFLMSGQRATDEIVNDSEDQWHECTGVKWRYKLFEKYKVTSERQTQAMFNSQYGNGKDMLFLVPNDEKNNYIQYIRKLWCAKYGGTTIEYYSTQIDYDGKSYYLVMPVK